MQEQPRNSDTDKSRTNSEMPSRTPTNSTMRRGRYLGIYPSHGTLAPMELHGELVPVRARAPQLFGGGDAVIWLPGSGSVRGARQVFGGGRRGELESSWRGELVPVHARPRCSAARGRSGEVESSPRGHDAAVHRNPRALFPHTSTIRRSHDDASIFPARPPALQPPAVAERVASETTPRHLPRPIRARRRSASEQLPRACVSRP